MEAIIMLSALLNTIVVGTITVVCLAILGWLVAKEIKLQYEIYRSELKFKRKVF